MVMFTRSSERIFNSMWYTGIWYIHTYSIRHIIMHYQYSVLGWKSNPMNEWAYADTKFQMLKIYEKINKFSESIISEIIQIGILVILFKSQNMKNIPVYLWVNSVSIYFFIKTNKYMALRSWAKNVGSEIVYMHIDILFCTITHM